MTASIDMKNTALIAASLSFIAWSAWAAWAAQPTRSIWDGVYTEAQAARGETVYVKSCESCHMASLEGDPVEEIPALVFDAFMMRWSGKSVGELQEVIGRSMPKDMPGSLGRQAYADVVAFILSKNEVPAGRVPLDRDPERLKTIRIERK